MASFREDVLTSDASSPVEQRHSCRFHSCVSVILEVRTFPHKLQSLSCERLPNAYSLGLCRTVMSGSPWQRPLADSLTDVSLAAAAPRDVLSQSISHCCGNVSTASTSFTTFTSHNIAYCIILLRIKTGMTDIIDPVRTHSAAIPSQSVISFYKKCNCVSLLLNIIFSNAILPIKRGSATANCLANS